ncbi:MAG TPA: exonuclease subunit SbcD [Candidatus Dojkabacteria bacterium]|jgi:exonuclease SbcD
MKLLHTADWHLGKKLNNFSRFEEQIEVLDEICEIADKEEVNAVLIAGDLFDSFNPSTDAEDLFYKTLKKLSSDGNRAVIAIAGNHDSPDRIESPNPLARECGIIFAGYPDTKIPKFKLESGLEVTKSDKGFVELDLPNCDEPLRIILAPYANEFRLKKFLGNEDPEAEMRDILQKKWKEISEKYMDKNGVNILLGHFFIIKKGEKIEENIDEERPILHIGGVQEIYSSNLPKNLHYAAFGHIHRKIIVDDQYFPIVYSSSPLAYSFSEANQDKYVTTINVTDGKTEIQEIRIQKGRKLIRKSFRNPVEAEEWLTQNQNILVELTLETENYLTTSQRKSLLQCHDGIITIIPRVKNALNQTSGKRINLEQNIDELFEDYFESKHNQMPNEEIKNIFKEIISNS